MPVNWEMQKLGNRTELDLSPLNQFAIARRDKRDQSLADLTLTNLEKKARDDEEITKIIKMGRGNLQQIHQNLMREGYSDKAMEVQQYAQKQQQAQQEIQIKQNEENENKLSQWSDISKTILDSEKPLDMFINARKDAVKRKLPISENLLNYFPTDEEIRDGRIDPNVYKELDYFSKIKSQKKTGPLTLEERLEQQDNLYLLKRKEAQQNLNNRKEFEDYKTGVDVNKPLTKVEESRERLAEQNLILKGEELKIKLANEAREKQEHAKKIRAYTQKNKGVIDGIQTFLDRAKPLLDNKGLDKTSGGSRYLPGGSEVPIFETKGKDLQADIDLLVSLGVVEKMAQLKSESSNGSTGFGALALKELETLQNSFSLLGNKEISANKKRAEIKTVYDIMERRHREQRELDRQSNLLLGPEKTAEQIIKDQNTITDNDLEGF